MKLKPSLQRGFSSGGSLRPSPPLSSLCGSYLLSHYSMCAFVIFLSVSSSRLTISSGGQILYLSYSPIYPKNSAQYKSTNMSGTDKSFTVISLLWKNLHDSLTPQQAKTTSSPPSLQLSFIIKHAEFFSFHLVYSLNLSKLAFLQILTCAYSFQG